MKNKIKFFCFLLSLSVLTNICLVNAVDFGDFKKYVSETYFNPLAKELGAVIGGGVFHQGKSLGFPGFDVGIKIPVKKLPKDFVFKSPDADAIALVWGQAELGLPGKIDILARLLPPVEGLAGFGVGVRYGIFKSIIPGLPSISAILTFHSLTHDMFNASTLSANVVASFGLPLITPYVGIGLDNTNAKATDKAIIDAGLSGIGEIKGSASGTRLEAGINFKPIPLLYIQLGYGLANADTAYTIGAGIKF